MIYQNASVKHAENGFMHIVFSEKKDVGFCRECLYPLDHFGFYWNGELSLCTTCYSQKMENETLLSLAKYDEDTREYGALF
jgi:predicted amidophosphoribosyltransferase